jgi:tRNA pseudouridine38-40 synthase
MEQRYFFECAYDGTDFSGWQRQPNAETVQQMVELMLSRRFKNTEIPILGCGRTDAGVHANQFYFHVDLPNHLDLEQLKYTLNKMLPTSIVIFRIILVSIDRHARFAASSRSYKYFIHVNKNPFLDKYSWHFPHPLDIEKMNRAARLLLGEKDFTSFSKLNTDVFTNICNLTKAEWLVDIDGHIVFEITANRFLRNMVRAVVGTLLEVGQGQIEPEAIVEILKAKDRSRAGISVPAKGLFLDEVKYDFLNH